jgi:hypothetical protein
MDYYVSQVIVFDGQTADGRKAKSPTSFSELRRSTLIMNDARLLLE